MSWLTHHNSEINWKTGKVKIMRCPDKCEKQWKTKQTKPGQQKEEKKEQKKKRMQREKKKEFRKLTVEKEIEITKMIEEKQKEEDLIEIRTV